MTAIMFYLVQNQRMSIADIRITTFPTHFFVRFCILPPLLIVQISIFPTLFIGRIYICSHTYCQIPHFTHSHWVYYQNPTFPTHLPMKILTFPTHFLVRICILPSHFFVKAHWVHCQNSYIPTYFLSIFLALPTISLSEIPLSPPEPSLCPLSSPWQFPPIDHIDIYLVCTKSPKQLPEYLWLPHIDWSTSGSILSWRPMLESANYSQHILICS